jgi:hypothetical protein
MQIFRVNPISILLKPDWQSSLTGVSGMVVGGAAMFQRQTPFSGPQRFAAIKIGTDEIHG